jgi:hypothetical protein
MKEKKKEMEKKDYYRYIRVLSNLDNTILTTSYNFI